MERLLPVRLIRLAPIVLPIVAIALARAMTHTEWAAAHAWLAALLFAWIVADSLMLAAIAKAPKRKPGLRTLLAAGTLASAVILLGAAAPVRAAILSMPPLLAAAGLTATLFLLWSARLVARALARGASAEDAAALVLPPKLVAFAFLESRMMRLALFGWRRAQDIPQGAMGFDYHRYLLPMLYALLVLQAIELGVMHVLLLQWNATAAWIWFGLGLAGGLWLVGLAQGFRIHPVLLTDEGLRVRSGLLVDMLVPYDRIVGSVTGFAAAEVKATDTLNQAVLSWPNVMLALARPVRVHSPLGGTREVVRIAMRIDDSADFLAALQPRIPA